MRVLDSSVLTDAVASVGAPGVAARRLAAVEDWLHVPAMATAEVVSALRSMVRRGDLAPEAARSAGREVVRLRTRTYAFAPFLDRVWSLRKNVTTYDGWWIAVAEALGADLVTGDERLLRAGVARCRVLRSVDALAR